MPVCVPFGLRVWLPADHSLWKMNKAIISAHYAGLYADLQRYAECFAENLDAFPVGKPLFGALCHDRLC